MRLSPLISPRPAAALPECPGCGHRTETNLPKSAQIRFEPWMAKSPGAGRDRPLRVRNQPSGLSHGCQNPDGAGAAFQDAANPSSRQRSDRPQKRSAPGSTFYYLHLLSRGPQAACRVPPKLLFFCCNNILGALVILNSFAKGAGYAACAVAPFSNFSFWSV